MSIVQRRSTVDYFPAATAVEGVEKFFANTTPIAIAAQKLRHRRQFAANGLGADGDKEISTSTYAAAFVLLIGLGVLSYQAGKAMAPTKQDESTWGIVGIPMGLLLPFGMGLGVMGTISNRRKK